MGEFINQIRQQAISMLRSEFGHHPTPESDPLLELLAFLLEKSANRPEEEVDLTTDEWLLWNQSIADRPEEVSQAMKSVLETERAPLPHQRVAMVQWAAWLVASTLDRMEME